MDTKKKQVSACHGVEVYEREGDPYIRCESCGKPCQVIERKGKQRSVAVQIVTPKTPKKNGKERSLKHPLEYERFITWCALPEPFREPKDHQQLAGVLGVHIDTLTDWKKREGFWDEVHNLSKKWGREKTPNAMAAFYRELVRVGDAARMELWLRWFEGYVPKERRDNANVNATLSEIIDRIQNAKKPGINPDNAVYHEYGT